MLGDVEVEDAAAVVVSQHDEDEEDVQLPPEDSIGGHDHEGLPPAGPDPGQPDPKEPISWP